MGLPDKLKSCRQELNLTQNELAMLIGVDRNYITRYETGRVTPSPHILYKMAKALGTSVENMLDIKDDDREGITDKELLLRFKQAQYMAEEDKKVLLKLIDAMVNNSRVPVMKG